MISVLGPVALLTSTTILLALPLAPALRELLAKQDAGPLVTRKDDGRISNFAQSLRARCEAFQPLLAKCAERGDSEEIRTEDGRLLLVGQGGQWSGAACSDVAILCAFSVELPDNFRCVYDFYSRGSVHSGRKNLFRALLSEASVHLGEGTQILRWIHAEEQLQIGPNCLLFGRTSAGKSIVLSSGTKFERMRAPVIFSSPAGAELYIRHESAAFTKLAQAGIGRTRRFGRTEVESEEQHFGDLVAARGLEIEERASVFGSVKANGDVCLRKHAEVEGSIVATKRIQVDAGCFIKGPLISEHEIVIGPGVQVGLPDSPTTVSAPRIQIAPGSVLHGTVWARLEGRVGV